MSWYHFIAYFLGGVFIVNSLPHYIMGTSGRMFPTPFGNPPGVGESSSMTNVIWGIANLVVGLTFLQAGDFRLGYNWTTLPFAVGFAFMSIMLVKHFGKLYSPQD
jgi:hypothetical protein